MEIKIYRHTIHQAYMAAEKGMHYSLSLWSSGSKHYVGEDDGGKLYMLPDGYVVGKDIDESPQVYDKNGGMCEIVESHGGPALAPERNAEIIDLKGVDDDQSSRA